MRNLLSKILLMVMALSLSAWAMDDEYCLEPSDPGSAAAGGSQNNGSHTSIDIQELTEPAEPGSAVTSYHGSSYLGIDIQDITAERVAPLKLKEERGVEVVMVDQDAPAGKAGVKEHDVILEFNGTRVEGVEQLRRMIHEIPSGRTVTLGLSRDGQPVTLQVQLADRTKAMTQIVVPHIRVTPQIPVMPEILLPPDNDIFPVRIVRSGLQIESLTPQLGEFLGVKGGTGILVRSVDKGSPGESAGLKAGDVIVRVESEKIANRGDWNMALRTHNAGKITLGVIRDKHEQSFSLTLPERSKDHSRIWMPGEGMQLEDLGIDIDRSELEHISTEARQAAAQMREQLRKIGLQTKADDLERQLKPQMDELRHSLEEMRRSVQKAASEL
jgi:serine protease Do